jgi:hypothetical protein
LLSAFTGSAVIIGGSNKIVPCYKRVEVYYFCHSISSLLKGFYSERVLNRPCFTPRSYPRENFSSISRCKNSFATSNAFTGSRASPPQGGAGLIGRRI